MMRRPEDRARRNFGLEYGRHGLRFMRQTNVDMATYKAEFLSHYWHGRMRPRYAYAFGLIDKWAHIASIAPGLVNLFTQLPGLSSLAKLVAGMPQQRQVPAFASETFKSWFKKRKNGGASFDATGRNPGALASR